MEPAGKIASRSEPAMAGFRARRFCLTVERDSLAVQ
jgi:hypothetical protein